MFRTILLACCLLAVGTAQEIYHGVAVAPDGMNAWAVTIDTFNIYHTTDFGAGWQLQAELPPRDFFDVFFLDTQRGWTCGRIGTIWHTSDGGANWTRQNLGGPKFATRVMFIDDMLGWSSSGEAILLLTTDGGRTWEMNFFPDTLYPTDTVDFQGVWFTSADSGWLAAGRFPYGDTFAGGQGYICRTADGGVNWDLIRRDTSYDFYDVRFRDDQTGWVVGGDDRTMAAVALRTDDAGQTWSAVALPGEARFLRALELVGDRHLWACGRNGTIIRSTDAGANWEFYQAMSDTTLFDIDFADTLRGMVSGSSVICATVDGGRTWSRVLGAVAEPATRPAPRLGLRVLANPTRDRVDFDVSGVPGRARLAIHDPAGRLVALLERTGAEATISWYCSTTAGSVPLPGTYVALLESAAGRESVRFVLGPPR